jgi:hypothetical protein
MSRNDNVAGFFYEHTTQDGRHCEERKRRSNPTFSGLLRFARNDVRGNFPRGNVIAARGNNQPAVMTGRCA